jgi:hypothetical protein
MVATILQDWVNLVLLAEALGAADEFDLQAVLGCQPLGVLPQRFAQRLPPLGVVGDANVMSLEISAHPFGVTQSGQGALRKGVNDLLAVTFG